MSGAMYRLKAYFGMVPAEEMADYVDDRYVPRRGREYGSDQWEDDHRRDDHRRDDRRDDQWDDRRDDRRDRDDERPEPVRSVREEWARSGPSAASGPGAGATRGALAMQSELQEPTRLPTSVPPPAVPEQRDRGAAALARITTLQPRSYKEARTIGEHYRDGRPVIINLTELDAADAKRLVDFAAGLAFALRGQIDKVTNRVFLLTPEDVEVSADDARKLAQRSVGGGAMDASSGIFRQD